MTTSIKEQTIRPSWPVEKIQEVNTKMKASHVVARIKLMDDAGEEAIEKMRTKTAAAVAEMFKEHGVKTPLDLVKHLAEKEANLFGAEVAIAGDEKEATLINKKPVVWLAVQEMKALSKEQEEKATKLWREWLSDLGRDLGMKVDVQTTPDHKSARITFKKAA